MMIILILAYCAVVLTGLVKMSRDQEFPIRSRFFGREPDIVEMIILLFLLLDCIFQLIKPKRVISSLWNYTIDDTKFGRFIPYSFGSFIPNHRTLTRRLDSNGIHEN
jgi:hypothetical protein